MVGWSLLEHTQRRLEGLKLESLMLGGTESSEISRYRRGLQSTGFLWNSVELVKKTDEMRTVSEEHLTFDRVHVEFVCRKAAKRKLRLS